MAITTNFTNLKGNFIRFIENTPATPDVGQDVTTTYGEFSPNIEAPFTTAKAESTFTVVSKGGVRGVKFHSDNFVPNGGLDANGVPGTTLVSDSIVGDIYLELDEDRMYERIADTDPDGDGIFDTETWEFLSDFTGTTGATGSSISGFSGTASALQFEDSDGDPIGVPIDLRGERGTTDIVFDDNPTVTGDQVAVDFDRTDRYTIDVTFALSGTLGPNNNLQYRDGSGTTIVNAFGPRAEAGWTPAGSTVADGVLPTPGNPTYEVEGVTISIGIAGSDNTQIAADFATVLPDYWRESGLTGFLATSDGPILTITRDADFGAVTRIIANGEWVTTPSDPTDTEQLSIVTGIVTPPSTSGGGSITAYDHSDVTIPATGGHIDVTIGDITTGRTSTGFENFGLEFTVPANKFSEDTVPEGLVRTQLLFISPLDSSPFTQPGMQGDSTSTNDNHKFRFFWLDNTSNTTETVDDIVAAINFGLAVPASTGNATGITWAIHAVRLAGTNTIRFSGDPDDVTSDINFTLDTSGVDRLTGVTSDTRVPPAVESTELRPTPGIDYTVGDLTHYTSEAYFCYADYTSTSVATATPDNLTDNWKQIT